MDRLPRAFAMIDAANAADPGRDEGRPAALVYGERMTAELDRLFPGAGDVPRIAARGQHIERWLLPRAEFPAGKEGYHAWRWEQARRHGRRVAAIMADAGYPPEACDRVGVLLRKEGLKRDGEVQAQEDAICFVFLRWYVPAFAEGRTEAELLDILRKTARKMSEAGRLRVLEEFTSPDAFAAAIRAP